MFEKTEVIQIIVATLLLAYLIQFPVSSAGAFALGIGLAIIVLWPHILAHKFAAFKLNCRSTFSLLEWKRYGLRPGAQFKFPIPIWLIIPIAFAFATKGLVKIFTIEGMNLDTTEGRVGRVFTELNEGEVAAIAVVGPITNLVIGFFSSLIGYQDFALVNVWFALFSLIPLGNLDGTKVFFGGKILWAFMFILTLIMLILLHVTNPIISIIAGFILAAVLAIWLLKMETYR